jgi:hypothetical protein
MRHARQDVARADLSLDDPAQRRALRHRLLRCAIPPGQEPCRDGPVATLRTRIWGPSALASDRTIVSRAALDPQ